MVAEPSRVGARPIIVVNGRHLHEIAGDAWQVLLDSNDPPWLFRHGRFIATVERDDDERPVIRQLGLVGLKGHLDRHATWVAQKRDQLLPARPPKDVVEDMLELDKPLPVLRGLAGTPVFASDGALVATPGYSPKTRLYYEPLGAPIRDVPAVPGQADVERARHLILDEWLVDFPFVEAASCAHVVAAALTPVAREFMKCPTPLLVIDAPTEGTGKGFLAGTVGIVLSGREPSPMTEGRGDDEMRKRITAVLRDGRPVILLDNVKRQLDAAALASVLTTTTWTDRVLGKSETIVLPNRALWLATGNNVQLDREIARRSVWIRLDARLDRPWERKDFKHDPLLPWVHAHRADLVWALLVLVCHWIAQGRPQWDGQLLGTYEGWCRVIGGILTSAGIEGFLENREELYRRVDAATEEWRSFVACWWQAHGEGPVKTAQLYELVRELDLLPSIFKRARDDASDRALKTMLGAALAKARDRRYGDLFIRHLGADGHQKGALYRLEPAGEPPDLAEPSADEDQGSAEVPLDNGSMSDSNAEAAEPAEPLFNTSREEFNIKEHVEGTSLEAPHLPHVPQVDSEPAFFDAEPWRNLSSPSFEVPHCPGCGGPLSVLVKTGLCGRCKVWGVVPEWAEMVARRAGA